MAPAFVSANMVFDAHVKLLDGHGGITYKTVQPKRSRGINRQVAIGNLFLGTAGELWNAVTRGNTCAAGGKWDPTKRSNVAC